ncbi:MAG TPA: hypothetical protein VFO76_04355, partial [Candidatus Kapabacteria bacterium]|nr:hypothetical protein [Candidatus Kapabacteria bacterium]
MSIEINNYYRGGIGWLIIVGIIKVVSKFKLILVLCSVALCIDLMKLGEGLLETAIFVNNIEAENGRISGLLDPVDTPIHKRRPVGFGNGCCEPRMTEKTPPLVAILNTSCQIGAVDPSGSLYSWMVTEWIVSETGL